MSDHSRNPCEACWRHRLPGVTIEFPWPEPPARVEARVRGIVESVVFPDELVDVRLEWVTPSAHRFDSPDAGWVVLRLTVVARGDEVEHLEIWGPDWHSDWDTALAILAGNLEDWVCETRFAWGQQRSASIPE